MLTQEKFEGFCPEVFFFRVKVFLFDPIYHAYYVNFKVLTGDPTDKL